jgi:hypothetical protein
LYLTFSVAVDGVEVIAASPNNRLRNKITCFSVCGRKKLSKKQTAWQLPVYN